MAVSRREFLHRVGRAGGYSAAFLMMQGMGLMEATAATQLEPAAPGIRQGCEGGHPGSWDRRVGGRLRAPRPGIRMHGPGKPRRDRGDGTGRCAAETGSRSWTARRRPAPGTRDNYQNFGPAGCPPFIKPCWVTVRSWASRSQVEVNMTRSAFLQNDNANGGKPMVLAAGGKRYPGTRKRAARKGHQPGSCSIRTSPKKTGTGCWIFCAPTVRWMTRASMWAAIAPDTPRRQAQATRPAC